MVKYFYLFMLLIALLAGCSKDDSFEVNEMTLKGSFWKGTFEYEGIKVYNINISFETEDKGKYVVPNADIGGHERSLFDYKVDGKIIQISGGFNNLLLGTWWIYEKEEKYLLLKRDIEYEGLSSILKLERKF